jgi:hypothetical protein
MDSHAVTVRGCAVGRGSTHKGSVDSDAASSEPRPETDFRRAAATRAQAHSRHHNWEVQWPVRGCVRYVMVHAQRWTDSMTFCGACCELVMVVVQMVSEQCLGVSVWPTGGSSTSAQDRIGHGWW